MPVSDGPKYGIPLIRCIGSKYTGLGPETIATSEVQKLTASSFGVLAAERTVPPTCAIFTDDDLGVEPVLWNGVYRL